MGMQSFLHAEISLWGFQGKEGIGNMPEIRLPIRQFTEPWKYKADSMLSKLPVRQFTYLETIFFVFHVF